MPGSSSGPVVEAAVAGAQRRRYVFAVANQKGGCGKTTTAVNLAAALANRGLETLLIDLDPQFNATSAVGLEPAPPSMADLMARRVPGGLDALVRPTPVPLLSICPSSLDLAQVEVQLASAVASEAILADALEGLRHPARLVLVDCPPSLGKLTLNALAAATAVIVPVSDPWALHGVRFLDESIATAQRLLRNPGLRVLGYLHTFHDGRTTLSRQVGDALRARFDGRVFETTIPVNAKLRETSAVGQPIAVYRPGSALAEQYDRLAEEVLARVS